MSLKNIIVLYAGLSCLFCVRLYANEVVQESAKDSVIISESNDSVKVIVWERSVSPFIEILGKGFVSVNVDFRFKKAWAISVGLQPGEGLMPDIMFYHFSGVRRRFEAGGGLSAGFRNDFTLGGILIHGVIGYRYQKKKGLFFRVGFTPLYTMFFDEPDRNRFLPFPGISLGYSF
jgi:hypothetical protein